jgi:glycerophosphoryl diester phosphodiesterase
MRLPFVIGHRGLSSDLAPENTLEALKLASSYGARAVEFDVQIASCGTPIVFHDDDLFRLTATKGKVYEKTYQELACLKILGTACQIPSLEKYIQACFSLNFMINLEIKPRNDFDCDTAIAVVDFLKQILTPEQEKNCLISSFHQESLSLVHAKYPKLAVGILYESLAADWLDDAKTVEACSIHLWDQGLEKKTVESVKSQGYQCAVYTVNDVNRAKTLASWGVNAIFTDHPEYAFL